jgi:hypothetical protein
VRWVCALIVALTVAGTATAADPPHVRQTIVPGRSIGKVALGMTFAQVKKMLGAPEAVISSEEGRFGSKRVEYSWNLSEWRVAFVYTAKTNRAVVIRSSTRGEKTKEGVGMGALQARVERVYRQKCRDAFIQSTFVKNFVGRVCSLNLGGRRTTFLISKFCSRVPPSASACERRYTRWAVSEIGIFDVGQSVPWEFNPDIRRPQALPHVQQRIVPGQAIGRVALGMTLSQVKKALGVPESVIERRSLGFGKTWVEYSWNFTSWRIAFVNGRAVRIGTSVGTEKTREGVGIGTSQTRVERTFGVRCIWGYHADTGRGAGFWCVVTARSGARTAFVLETRCKKPLFFRQCPASPGEDFHPPQVREIYVFAPGEQLPVKLGVNMPRP